MTDLSRRFDFAPNTLIKSAEVDAEFNQILPQVNALYSAYQMIEKVEGQAADTTSAGAWLFSASGPIVLETTNASVALSLFYLASADYTIADRTTKLRIRAQCYTNAQAPDITFTVGLYPVTSVTGAADTIQATLGAVVAGSTVAFGTPSASQPNQGNSGDFTFPADGHYALGVNLSGTPTANSFTSLAAQLQRRWT